VSVDSVKSAQRVIEVLMIFARFQTPLTQSELLEATKYPQSSMTALLKTLTASGLLHYNGYTRQYFPTMLVKDLGGWIKDPTPEAEWVTKIMTELREYCDETVALGVQNDTIIMYLRSIQSDHIVRYHVRPGEQRSLLDTSMGWLLLSRLDKKQIEQIYRRSSLESRANAGDLEHFMAVMARIREQDHCFVANIPPKAGTVSMLLPARFNGAPLVIGVGGFIDRVEPRKQEFLEKMRELIDRHAPKTLS